jgi:hypothetical protein
MPNGDWGGKRPGSGRRPGLTDTEKEKREREYQKFSYMADLSDKMPIQLMPVEVPCQTPGCFNMTHQGCWQGTPKHIFSLRPICSTCIVLSGHVPLDREVVE